MMRLGIALVLGQCVFAQPVVTTVVGNTGLTVAEGVRALDYPIRPGAIGVTLCNNNNDGRIFFADNQSDRVFHIKGNGTLQTVLGNGTRGTQLGAQLSAPSGLVCAPDGTLFVSDAGNRRVLRVAPNGAVFAFAGGGNSFDDAVATNIRLVTPAHLARDSDGSIYIADKGAHLVWKVTPDNRARKVAGTGQAGFSPTANAALSPLNSPSGIALDSDGDLLIADTGNHRIRKVQLATRTIVNIAGTGQPGDSGDGGPAAQAQLDSPLQVGLHPAGILVANGQTIRLIASNGTIRRVAGKGVRGEIADGVSALDAAFAEIGGLAVEHTGDILALDTGAGLIVRFPLGGPAAVIAGNRSFARLPDRTPSRSTPLQQPIGIAFGPQGLYIADSGRNQILRVDESAQLTHIVAGAGTGAGAEGDGPATGLSLKRPHGLAIDASGRVFFTETGSHRVRRINLDGTVTTLAGNGSPGFSGDDGPASAARLDTPTGIAVDRLGNVFVADSGNGRIRKIDVSGKIATLADLSGLRPRLGLIDVDSNGNLYVPDAANLVVRKVSPNGSHSVFAGGALSGNNVLSSPLAPATAVILNLPKAVRVAGDGSVLVLDGPAVFRVLPNGTFIIAAGRREDPQAGPTVREGIPSTLAYFYDPASIALDGFGDLHIADTGNNRIRAAFDIIVFDSPNYEIQFRAVTGAPAPGPVTAPLTSSRQGPFPFQAAISPPDARWLTVDPLTGAIPGTLRFSANHAGLAAGVYRARVSVRITSARSVTRDFNIALDVSNPSAPPPSPSQTPPASVITTVAGGDWFVSPNGRSGLEYPLGWGSSAIAACRDGRILVADERNHYVLQIADNGTVRAIAGNGAKGFSGDLGPAIGARLNAPGGVACDSLGNVFISDTGNYRIRRVAPDGLISTIAGTGSFGFNGGADGSALAIPLTNPRNLATDSEGAVYVAEAAQNVVWRIAPNGAMRRIAGTGTPGADGDGGQARTAQLNSPWGVAVDQDGNVLIADSNNHRIRRVLSDGVIERIAGTGVAGITGDGESALNARLLAPRQIAIHPSLGLVIGDSSSVIRAVGLDGIIRRIAGTGEPGLSGDGGPALAARINNSWGIAVDAAANIYSLDQAEARVRRFRVGGAISTIAGNGGYRAFSGDLAAASAFFESPMGIHIDPRGVMYVTDNGRHQVLRVAEDGRIRVLAGRGFPSGVSEDGPALAAALNDPRGVATDAQGLVYFAEAGSHHVRRINADGTLTTVAGTGIAGSTGDGGPATLARLSSPTGLAFDSAGNMYVTSGRGIRKITPEGTISSHGDLATILGANPRLMDIDSADILYVADEGGRIVYRIARDGRATIVAGGGNADPSAGGPATQAILCCPQAVRVAKDGAILIADGNAVYRVASGTIRRFAGNGRAELSGDGGTPVNAGIDAVAGIAVHPTTGDVYIADAGNQRIRAVFDSPAFELSSAAVALDGNSNGVRSEDQLITINSNLRGIPYTATVVTDRGGDWLRVSPPTGTLPATLRISADPSGLAPGAYTATITIRSPEASPPMRTITFRYTVGPPLAPALTVDSKVLSFAEVQGAPPSVQPLAVGNAGSGSLDFTVSVQTRSGSGWLSLTTTSGTATANSPALVGVRVDPSAAGVGTFTGAVTIRSGTASSEVPVVLTVSDRRQTIQLSQTGLTFVAVSGGGRAPTQTFGVLNTGQGVMSWTAAASTASGGNWLVLTTASGSSSAQSLSVPQVTVGVNAAGLTPGDYYGQVTVEAPGASNSPQSVNVVLQVLPPGSNPGPIVRPTGLIFTGVAGGAAGPAQEVQISNLSATALAFRSGRLTLDGRDFFEVSPETGSVAPDTPFTLRIRAVPGNLPAGIRRGVVTLVFGDGATRTIGILLVLLPAGNSANSTPKDPRLADGCEPRTLQPVLTLLGAEFSVPAAWPNAIETRITDDCGDPMTDGLVLASFSNGDAPIPLVPLRDGRWSGTWRPGSASAREVVVTITAEDPVHRIRGTAQVTGSVRPNQDPPFLAPGAIVSGASFVQQAPVAPGSLVSIFGERLTNGLTVANTNPLPTDLAGTRVLLAGRLLPLVFTSDRQINAIIPYDVPVNARHQLIVRRGNTFTVPENVSVAAAQPAIFSKDSTGRGQGSITDASGRFYERGNPAKAGDPIVLFCAGLGDVTPAVSAGARGPAEGQPRTANPVTVTVGGRTSEAAAAILAPGLIGIYYVNSTVPGGVTAGDSVSVSITVAGQPSNTVTMAVQ